MVAQRTGFGPRRLTDDPTPPRATIDQLEAALLAAERERDAARAAWLQAGTDDRARLANLRAAYHTNDGIVTGIKAAINMLTGGAQS